MNLGNAQILIIHIDIVIVQAQIKENGIEWPHLENVSSLVSNPDLKDAAQAAKETLRVKCRGPVHSLGSRVAVNMVHGEELLQTLSISSGYHL